MTEYFALIFSDGSLGLLDRQATIDDARQEARLADRGEEEPEHFTHIARVEIKIIEIIDGPPIVPEKLCPRCGRQLDDVPREDMT
jgi:hypothetical protein